MLLTAKVLKSHFEKHGIKAVIQANPSKRFSGVWRVFDKCDFEDSRLYFVPSGFDTAKIPGNINYFKADRPENDELTFYHAQECVTFFNDWSSRLHKCIISGDSLDNFLDIASEALENPLLIDDTAFRTVAMSRRFEATKFRDNEWMFMLKNGYHSPEYVDAMLASPVFENASSQPRPQLNYYPFLAHPNMAMAIRSGDSIVGILTVIALERPFTDGDADICEYLGNFLSVVLAKRQAAARIAGGNIDIGLLKNIILGKVTDPESIQLIFSRLGFNKELSHCIALLAMKESSPTNPYLLQRITNHISSCFEKCISIAETDSVILILEKSKNIPLREYISRIDADMLSSGHAVMGFSLDFSDPGDMPVYYRQAQASVHFGNLSRQGGHMFCYDEVVIYDLLDSLSDKRRQISICHPAIFILEKHDRENSSRLLDTLRVLIKTRNDTALAAKELFLHRNSLYYRIRLIESLTGIDLKDQLTLEHLSVSIKVYDMLNNTK